MLLVGVSQSMLAQSVNTGTGLMVILPIKSVPRNVHFTSGGPLFRNWKGKREIDNHYAKEWNELYKEMIENNG
jgi:hypothetical protein